MRKPKKVTVEVVRLADHPEGDRVVETFETSDPFYVGLAGKSRRVQSVELLFQMHIEA